MTAPLTRRVVLAAGATAGLSACTDGSLSLPPPPPPDPDRTVAVTALVASVETLALVRTVLAAGPASRRALRTTVGVHEQHVDLLRRAAPDLEDLDPPVRRVPRADAAAYALVIGQEERLARILRRSCLRAESGSFARVLAAMAAAATQQAAELRST